MPSVGEGYEWRPGSFTKNFSWGAPTHGLMELHSAIRIGFADEMKNVPRAVFRERMASASRIDFIPMNFFLFNKSLKDVDYILADELVFQALTSPYGPRFDKLAIFAFNFSYAGVWSGASRYQRRPALWAANYILQRVHNHKWDTSSVSADDIESFLIKSPQYTGKTTRKVATNLNYLYQLGNIKALEDPKLDRGWVDCLFLALDRIVEDRLLDGVKTIITEHASLLDNSYFFQLSGKDNLAKRLASKHLINLYEMCGGRTRFDEEATKERTLLTLPEVGWLIANDERPRGAVHPSNPLILKSIPRSCALLARHAGFDDLSPDDLDDFDIEAYVRKKVLESISSLENEGINNRLSAEQLTRLTRGE